MSQQIYLSLLETEEGKKARKNPGGSVTFVVNGVVIRLVPDQPLTDEERKTKQKLTFKRGTRWTGAKTVFRWVRTHFDLKSVQTVEVSDPTSRGNKLMVMGYLEPTCEMSIQVFYRKTKRTPTLEKARNLLSAYGKGKTLQKHERWHVAGAIDYIKTTCPRFVDGVGLLAEDFNQSLESFYRAAKGIGKTISEYSRQMTDCTGKRKADFCM